MHRSGHSPQQGRIFAVGRMRRVLERGAGVICSDAGGVPTISTDETVLAGRRRAGAFDVVGSIDDAPVLLAGIAGTYVKPDPDQSGGIGTATRPKEGV